jgi:hypothetical protein
MTGKGNGVTWLGLVVSALGAFATQPDVQTIVSPKYATLIALAGTVLAAVGPSLRKPPAETK